MTVNLPYYTQRQAIHLLSSTLPQDKQLTPREREVILYLINNNPFPRKCFTGSANIALCKEFNIAVNTAYGYRRKLKKKKWITKAGHLSHNILTILKDTEQTGELFFKFKFKK